MRHENSESKDMAVTVLDRQKVDFGGLKLGVTQIRIFNQLGTGGNEDAGKVRYKMLLKAVHQSISC